MNLTHKQKYALVGIAFGACFPLLSILFEIFKHDYAFSLGAVAQIHGQNPLLYVIDTAPLFLGLFAYIGGIHFSKSKALGKSLEQEKIALQQALTFKEEFLANMSHEIRTPMNGVVGMIELMSETQLTKEQAAHLQTLDECSTNLIGIINNILDLSKLEANQMAINNEEVNVKQLIYSTHNLFKPNIASKGLISKIQVDDALDVVAVLDRTKTTQILSNLISNAGKFTDRGEITISAKVINNRIRIMIKDTGIGIPVEEQSKLFKKFSQIDSSSTKRRAGTGLGLEISKQLVQILAGQIGVISEGNGSIFWFEVPFHPVGQHVPAIISPSVYPKPKSTEVIHADILVVEDQAVNLTVLKLILLQLGCSVQVAANGKEGVEMCRAAKFDLVLMDIQMPVMDGIEAAALINKMMHAPPIIAVTANAMEGDKEKYLSNGFKGYIAKPYRKQELRDAMHIAIEGSIFLGKSALILEDDPMTSMEIKKKLESYGISVFASEIDVERALASIEKHPVDFAIIDVHLNTTSTKKENGLSFLQDPRAKNVRHALFLSGTSQALLLDELEQLNRPYAYCNKPIIEAEFKASLTALLKE